MIHSDRIFFPGDSDLNELNRERFWRDMETCMRIEPLLKVQVAQSLIRRLLMREFDRMPETAVVVAEWTRHAQQLMHDAIQNGFVPAGADAPDFPKSEAAA